MKTDALDRLLYEKLPAIYQIRDAEEGYPLQALLRVVAEQVDLTQQDIRRLYENWFVETCEPWAVPYVGDLIGLQTLPAPIGRETADSERYTRRDQFLFPRREVAQAVNHHRRKGTLSVLENLVNDIAGWPARAVEFHNLVTRFRSTREPKTQVGFRFPDVRDQEAMSKLDTPFDTTPRIPDVRKMEFGTTTARYNTPNVGLYVWRLKAQSLTRALAKCRCSAEIRFDDRRILTFYWLNPLGLPVQFVRRPVPEAELTQIAEESNLPDTISISALQEPNRDADPQTAPTAKPTLYGPQQSLAIFLNNQDSRSSVPANRVFPMDLSTCFNTKRDGASEDHAKVSEACEFARKNVADIIGADGIAVDPTTGICAIQGDPQPVYSTFHYAATADVGGGEYLRELSPESLEPNWIRRVRSDQFDAPRSGCIPPAIPLQAWLTDARKHRTGTSGQWVMVIEFCDSGTFRIARLDDDVLQLDPGETLVLRAGRSCRPVLKVGQGDCGPSAHVSLDAGSSLVLDGIVLDGGGLQIQPPVQATSNPFKTSTEPGGDCSAAVSQECFSKARVVMRHSTLLPKHSASCSNSMSLVIERSDTCVLIEHSITGPINVSYSATQPEILPCQVTIRDSIVDSPSSRKRTPPEIMAISGIDNVSLSVERTTILGRVAVSEMTLAQDSLFVKSIEVRRKQTGGMRFCYVPPNNGQVSSGKAEWNTPRQYYCQPSLAMERFTEKTNKCGGNASGDYEPCDQETVVLAEQTLPELIVPEFTSPKYGEPGYCQLKISCPREIRQGAEDEAEMGVYHDLYQPQREARLQSRLNEFVPTSMHLGLIYVN